MITRRSALFGAAAIGATATLSVPAAAAPRSKLIDKHWANFGGDAGPDHREWAANLKSWRSMSPDGVARFDYEAALPSFHKVSQYVAKLSDAKPTAMTRNAAFAYWANLYNAATVMLVLADYPVKSIKDVRGGLFNSGPWAYEVLNVEGRALSLDDIEHGILRPIWRDARLHYAVNCASIGCPNLPAKPWAAGTLNADLDRAARAFVNHPRGARVQKGRLYVSSIYEWFQEDFGGDDAGVIAHLKKYAKPSLAKALGGVDEIYDDTYDWSLNRA